MSRYANYSHTWYGHIASTHDAFVILQAVLEQKLPRLKTRPKEGEQNEIIHPGSVLVYEKKESGIKRWRDNFVWSSSRVSGDFHFYKEQKPDFSSSTTTNFPLPPQPNYRFDSEPLFKQVISVSTKAGQDFQLLSFYHESELGNEMGCLPTIRDDPILKHVVVPDGFFEVKRRKRNVGRNDEDVGYHQGGTSGSGSRGVGDEGETEGEEYADGSPSSSLELESRLFQDEARRPTLPPVRPLLDYGDGLLASGYYAALERDDFLKCSNS